MESMRRNEAKSSHHPNKVAVNSLPAESNKHSSGSGSAINNNKLNFEQQLAQSQQLKHSQYQQQQLQKASSSTESSSSTTSSSSSSGASTSSESKDTNFEYDDNEWDVGGIGDLIIDLDADIEKSSSTAVANLNTNLQAQQSTGHQISTNLAGVTASGSSGGGESSNLVNQILNSHEKSPSSASSSRSSSSPASPTIVPPSKSSSLSSLFAPLPLRPVGQQQSAQQPLLKQRTTNSSLYSSFQPTGKANSRLNTVKLSNLKLQQPALLAQLNSKSSSDHSRVVSSPSTSAQLSSKSSSSRSFQSCCTTSQSLQTARHSKGIPNASSTMSSQQSGGQGTGKTATKMLIDHQATLDKGLKMKIKRTKPGTKSSEAKHEIVKAEQNGTSSNAEENSIASNNSSSSASSGKKHSQINSTGVQSIQQNHQPMKRGGSSHRRDKTRDKTPHSRDKSDHGSSGGSSNSSNSSSNNSSSSSNTNNSSQNERPSTTCNCSLEVQLNGVQNPCTNISCVRNRTPTGPTELTNSSSLSQRICAPIAASQQPATSCANSLGSNPPSNASPPNLATAAESSTDLFPINNSTSVHIPNSGTPDTPGPPKEKLSSSSSGGIQRQQQQCPSPVSNSSSSSTSSIQQTSQSMSSTIVHNSSSQNNPNENHSQQQSISATVHHTISVAANCDDRSCSPSAKRPKCGPKDMIDICVGTSVGTITEPDCLGPCEPGTSVTLEGIVWHETEGGVLVVNVTWRGKTYVGTLLDCTRHDWAPPRFCDSPTEEFDSRTPKGRGKRGRSAALTPDLSNFTETRSSVHSKLRNGAKGRSGRTVTTTLVTTSTITTTSTNTASTTTSISNNSSSTTNLNTPSTSPTAFLSTRPEKRKLKDESSSPENEESSTQLMSNQTQSLVNPVTGLNVQITTKKCKTASPCAVSPVLLECPEQDCSKKYKHANGLRYHQSHAHGSGSMDEDSLQLPESPPLAPPTTPSPVPETVPMAQIPIASVDNAQVVPPPASPPSLLSMSVPATSIVQEVPTAANSTQKTSICILNATTQATTPSISTAGQVTSISNQMPQHPVPGGSITSGISGQALSQHQQHSIMASTAAANSVIEGNNQTISESCQLHHSQHHQSQMLATSSSIVGAPNRCDPQIKPSVLRFGSPSDNLSNNQNILSTQVPIRPTPTAAMATSSGAPGVTEVISQESSYSQSSNTAQQGLSNSKPQGFGKQKKNRSKSPVLGEYDNSTSRDNVQSPAYSDISDDSTPVIDSEMNDKSQPLKHSDAKKVADGTPPQITTLGSYGMYQFYPQQQYMLPPEHQGPKPPTSQSSPSPAEYNKSKDPLDLMTKPVQVNEPLSKESNIPPQNPVGPSAQNPNKSAPHFYPYNYMGPGYPYNIEPNYGPISMVSEDNKLNSISNTPHSLKEERSKENPSPSEHGKISGQMISTKVMKSETSAKEMKSEGSPQTTLPREPPPMHSMIPYTSLYQRYQIGTQQPLSREEEMRKFYIDYDQRRRQPIVSIKEESPSPSQPSLQHTSSNVAQGQPMSQISQSPHGQPSQPSQPPNSSQQKSVKSSHSTSQTLSQKATNLVKDLKEEKDVKIKQEGQKPTMETQGPPPPPTSQYFLHPQYLTPNFSFDPGHPVYRNVLMPTSPYNAPPYHLPMPRFHAPEDLSRNPGPKALDVLQQAANMQYYGSHKIHELSERALKSPNSNSKTGVFSPNVSQQGVSNTVSGSNIVGGPGILQSSAGPGGPLNLQPPAGAMASGIGSAGGAIVGPKTDGKLGLDPSNKASIGGSANDNRSPPPQRHVHTHHHTHVGLGYPMYTAPYGAAVLASQQAAAVAVINPFPPGPTK